MTGCQSYKALGNSMAVNVMQWIGERIAMVEALALMLTYWPTLIVHPDH
jgi:hypothetical protein